ncbi:MAG: RnfABCDGE type electron transport complex subunit D [Clostridia bacterium]|nr:RnfABCDGE type electron transport complex subunit D [Clostridia bacterium]
MENNLHLSVSPHIRSKITTQRIMLDVIIALLPALIAGTVIFGIRALLITAVCIFTCVAGEFVFNVITKKQQTVKDLSAVVTGLLLALNVPANIPVWQCVIGSLFAIIVVKCVFGGIGCNIVNPAITARVFMIIAFGAMAKAAFPVNVDGVSGATPLADLQQGVKTEILDLFLGRIGGSIGETSKLALLLGGIYLLARKVITWQIPVTFIGTVFVMSFLLDGLSLLNALYWILSGGLFIGAFFMATDYVTSPSTAWGKVIFGVGAGLLTAIIRFYGNYPEGVSFAILFMNILNPYIENATQRKLFGGEVK